MKSILHQELQNRGQTYMYNKGYWITRQETPNPYGYCDVWGIKSQSGNFETIAIEVKVSRSDARSRSQKYKEYGCGMANRHYILCPINMITPDDIDQTKQEIVEEFDKKYQLSITGTRKDKPYTEDMQSFLSESLDRVEKEVREEERKSAYEEFFREIDHEFESFKITEAMGKILHRLKDKLKSEEEHD